MAEHAATLVDDLLPQVPVRQWVLSFPYRQRYRLAVPGSSVRGRGCCWGVNVR